jgi:hypothetical protein
MMQRKQKDDDASTQTQELRHIPPGVAQHVARTRCPVRIRDIQDKDDPLAVALRDPKHDK